MSSSGPHDSYNFSQQPTELFASWPTATFPLGARLVSQMNAKLEPATSSALRQQTVLRARPAALTSSTMKETFKIPQAESL